jgi:hypothetical protein
LIAGWGLKIRNYGGRIDHIELASDDRSALKPTRLVVPFFLFEKSLSYRLDTTCWYTIRCLPTKS